MKDKDVRIGMKVVPHDKTAGVKGLKKSTIWEVAKDDSLKYLYVRGKEDGVYILSNKENYGIAEEFNACDFEPYINISDVVYQNIADAINTFSEALGKELNKAFDTLQELAEKNRDAIEEFAKKTEKERLDEEFQIAFEEWAYKNTSEGSVKIAFRAGFLAGRERK